MKYRRKDQLDSLELKHNYHQIAEDTYVFEASNQWNSAIKITLVIHDFQKQLASISDNGWTISLFDCQCLSYVQKKYFLNQLRAYNIQIDETFELYKEVHFKALDVELEAMFRIIQRIKAICASNPAETAIDFE
ncbi:hypothetical protein FHQ08_09980 [Lactobacillus sp. CC-MHH1034]|uniref:hypothetical protein n=1 Tax=Agrilactobacillus fermenti TaxID=2586909 RepID=UPI001E35FD28|nr:hypothetical protein [Agrilactobacillus fermenti]MCD2257051.1 hypothetical protein [Agrilactobacillus fermenti]